MQFLVMAHDGTDEGALDRRMAVREAHIHNGDRLRDEGHLLHAVALLDEGGTMIGTCAVYEYEKVEDLEKAFEVEPYLTGDVWREVTVTPCRVGPSFSK